MSQVTFRPMVEADLDAVVAIEQAAFSHPWTRKLFQEGLSSYQCWVMCADGVQIGHGVIQLILDEGKAAVLFKEGEIVYARFLDLRNRDALFALLNKIGSDEKSGVRQLEAMMAVMMLESNPRMDTIKNTIILTGTT